MKLYQCYNLTLFFYVSVTLVARFDASRNASPYYSEIQATCYSPRGAGEGGPKLVCERGGDARCIS